MVFIILLVFIPYFLMVNHYLNKMQEEVLSSSVSDNTLKSRMIFDLLNADFAKQYAMVSDSDLISEILSSDYDSVSDSDKVRVQNLLRTIQRSDDSVVDIMVYSTINQLRISPGKVSLYDRSKSPETWINTYRACKIPYLIFPRKEDSDTFDSIYTLRELYNDKGYVVGVFCVRMSYSNFEKMVRQAFGKKPQHILIVSDLGLILYSDDYSRINTLIFANQEYYDAFQSAASTDSNTIFWNDSVISVAKSDESGLILMSFMNKDEFYGKYNTFSFMLRSGGLLVLAISLISAYFISYLQYRSVSQVMQAIDDGGDLNVLHDSKLQSEFLYIVNAISSRSSKNKELDEQLSDSLEASGMIVGR